jgi:hypothetical protein
LSGADHGCDGRLQEAHVGLELGLEQHALHSQAVTCGEKKVLSFEFHILHLFSIQSLKSNVREKLSYEFLQYLQNEISVFVIFDKLTLGLR